MFLTSGAEVHREVRSGVAMTFVTDRAPTRTSKPAAGFACSSSNGGVQPTLLSFDVGVPLSRTTDRYRDLTGAVRMRSPFGLYVSFEQTL